MDSKLKQICLITTHDKVHYPYSLQSVEDFLVHRLKLCCDVITTSCQIDYNIQSNLQLSSTKTIKPSSFPQLDFNAAKIFNDCNNNEKNFLMLNPNFMPNFSAKNIHNLKCLMSPISARNRSEHVIACLLSTGAIELFSFNPDQDEINLFDKNLSEIQKENIKKLPKEISKFEIYKKFLHEISFTNFEWCPIAYDDFKILIAVTKSNKVFFYRIRNKSVTQEACIEIEDVSKNRIKWIDLNDKHYILVSTNKGNLIRYSVNLTDGVIKEIVKVDDILGKIKLPISNITVDYHEKSTLILCSKIHSLEVFQLNEKESKLLFSMYIDLTITGVEVCSNLQYFISVLNAKVYFLKLNKLQTTGQIALESCSRIEVVASNADDAQCSMKYGYYGIATSRNNVLVYISCYPQIAFDHLSNKQPARISVNLFTKYDPFEILTNNQSLKLTDYSDCVEAIHFLGKSKVDTLDVLESMNYNIMLNDEFVYYLKIQLIVINVKLAFYETRSTSIVEMIRQTRKLILEIIIVMHCHKVLNYLLKLKKINEIQFAVIRASANRIREYCEAEIEKEPFKTAADNFKPQFLETLEACDTKLQKVMLPPEICDCCEDVVAWNKLECNLSHNMKRCVVTNLMVSLDCKNFCRHCKESVIQLETLSNIFGNSSENINFYLCPLCDTKLVFYE